MNEAMFEDVDWTAAGDVPTESDLPYVTHSGILRVGRHELTVFRLSNGQAVIEKECLENFLGFMGMAPSGGKE